MENKLTNEIRAQIIAKAWKDEAFRNKLINNTKEAFKEFGIDIPANARIDVMQEEAGQFYFTLPLTPAQVKKLTPEELEKLAAAGSERTYDTSNENICNQCAQ